MKGLMVKDLRLLANQKQFFLIVVFMSVMLIISGQNMFFIVSYGTMICSFFTISTINYDEFNNGYEFLFTMPISRKGYVFEKYVFGFLTGGIVCIVLSIFCTVWMQMKNQAGNMTEWFVGSAAIYLILSAIVSLMIPVQLKFGQEKSRIVTFAATVVFFVALGVIGEVMGAEGIGRAAEIFDKIGFAVLYAAGAAVIVLIEFFSIMASIHIMEKKQF